MFRHTEGIPGRSRHTIVVDDEDVTSVERDRGRAQVQGVRREHQELSVCETTQDQTLGRGKLLLEHLQPEEIQGISECLIVNRLI